METNVCEYVTPLVFPSSRSAAWHFQPLYCCRGTLSFKVIPGSVTLVQVETVFKGPPILDLHVFPSKRVQLPKHHVTRRTQADCCRNVDAGFLTNVHTTFLREWETALGKSSTGPQDFSSPGSKGVATLSLQAKELRRELRLVTLASKPNILHSK